MSKATILLVDEVKIHQEVLKEYLRRSPVRVITADTGKEGLELAQRERPDLIVMNLEMPVRDCLTYCAVIKGDHTLKSTPVVMLINNSDSSTAAMCRRAGSDGFLSTPVLANSFLNLLHSFLPSIERRTTRISCTVPVTVTIDGAVMSGMSRDIGLGGLFVAVAGEVAPEMEVIVSFRVPVSAYALTVVKGRVAWVQSVPDSHGRRRPDGFGVEFKEILGEGLNRLRFSELSGFINGRYISMK